MQATFYTFEKRSNSTKQPSDSGTSLQIKLKSNCSVENPIFTLQGFSVDWNYFLWNGCYYFITDIIYVTNYIVEVHGTMDSLATYKANILATSAFILYSPAGNSNLVDTRLGVTNKPKYVQQTAKLCDNISQIGSILVNIVGEGNVGTYLISSDTLALLYNKMDHAEWLASMDTTDIVTIISSVFEQIVSQGSSTENIRSAIWIPFDIVADTSASQLYLGNFATNLGGAEIRSRIETHQTEVGIPWEYNDWRRSAPYTQVYLYIPFVGNIEIPSANIQSVDSLIVITSLNRQNGEVSIMVRAGASVIGVYGASTGVTIPIGTSNINQQKVGTALLKGAVSAGISAMSGNVIGAGMGASALASNLASLIEPTPSVIGNVSGDAAVGLGLNLIVTVISRNTPDGTITSAKSVIGAPLMQKATISTLGTGYVQCSGASVSGSMTETEREKINNALNMGVYIE